MSDTDKQPRDEAEIALDALRIRKLERNGKGQIVAHLEGADEPVVDVQVRRYFPWSRPDEYFSIRNADGKELAMLRSLGELDHDSRGIAEAELDHKVFNPKITHVLSHKREFGLTTMEAETDRGHVTVQFNSREDVRILSATRGLIRDINGNTLEIPNLHEMDSVSQRFLQRYF